MKNGEYILVVAPENYPGKKYRNRYCYKHHLVFWEFYNIIPKYNEIIHHIDGDKTNNDINNLKLDTRAKHTKYHFRNKKKKMLLLKCPGCNKEFVVEKRNSYLLSNSKKVNCCSRKCIGYYTNLTRDEQEKRIKNMFIKEFYK